MMLPNHLPTYNQLPKADLRREITPWRALTWAYADECVRVATNAPDDHHLYAAPGLAQTTYGERLARGSINGKLDAHIDAFAIDAFLWTACGGEMKPYDAIATAAEKRKPIPAMVVIPPLQVKPKLRDNGKPEMLYPLTGRNEPYLCLVLYEGYDPDLAARIAAAHAALHALFMASLASMVDLRLSAWKVVAQNPA